MKFRKSLLMCCLSAVFIAPTGMVFAEDPQTTFDSLFKDQIEAAKLSQDKEDDIKLAEELLKYNEFDDLDDDIRALLCQAAFELASESVAGEDIAANAMKAMIDLGPEYELKARIGLIDFTREKMRGLPAGERDELASDVLDQLMDLAEFHEGQMKFDEADQVYLEALPLARKLDKDVLTAINKRREGLKARKEALTRIGAIQKEILENPTAALAREAAEIYLFQLDQPEKANEFAAFSEDAAFEKMVKLSASDDVDEVADEEIGELALWWSSHAQKAPEHSKLSMHEKAHELLESAFEREGVTGITKLKVKRDLDKAEAYLASVKGADDASDQAGGAEQAPEPGKLLGSKVKLLPLIADRIKENRDHHRDLEVKSGKLFRRLNDHHSSMAFDLEPGDSYTLKFKVWIENNKSGIVWRLPITDKQELDVIVMKGGGTGSEHRSMSKQLTALQVRLGPEKRPYPVAIRVKRVGNRASVAVVVGRDVAASWSGPVTEIEGDWQPRLELAGHWNHSNWLMTDIVLEGKIRAKKF